MIDKKYIKDPLTEGKLYITNSTIVVWYYNNPKEDILLREVKNNEILLFCGRTWKNENLVKLTFLLNGQFVYMFYSTNPKFKTIKTFSRIKELSI